VALQGSSRSRHFNFRFQPDFSIMEVVLGAFAHRDACPLLITSIVAVKPEDQAPSSRIFWAYPVILAPLGDSILTLLCSVPEMLRTTMKPNGWRYAPSRVLVGGTRERRFAGTSLKPQKLPENAQTPTSQVHLVIMASNHFPRKNALLVLQRMCKKCRFPRKRHISGNF
jgi:hypothetical protein